MGVDQQPEPRLDQPERFEAIGRLVGGAAHDFNNSLMAIRGFADLLLLRLDAADPSYRHALGIMEAVDGACDVTRRLLAQVKVRDVLDAGR